MKVQQVKFEDLSVAECNARSKRSVNGVGTLSASISALGLLCPLIGIKAPDNASGVHVVAGQRRLAAITQLRKADKKAFEKIPVYILTGVTEAQALEMSLHENIERELLLPIDEAEAFARMNEAGLAVPEIAANFGRDQRFVRQRLQIAELPSWVKKAVSDNTLTLGVAQAMTSASKGQLTELKVAFSSGENTYLFNNAASMMRHISNNSHVKVANALFDIGSHNLGVVNNLFDDDMSGIVTDTDKFWELQNAAIEEAKTGFEEEGHEVHVFGQSERFPEYQYEKSKAKKHTVVISMDYDGAVEFHHALKLRKAHTPAPTDTGDQGAEEPEVTQGDLSKKLFLEVNEIRSMSLASVIAINRGADGYTTQIANALLMFGDRVSPAAGWGRPHHWDETLAAEHKEFTELDAMAEKICGELGISVPDGEWALSKLSSPGPHNMPVILTKVLYQAESQAQYLQSLLAAAHCINVYDGIPQEDSTNVVEMIGAVLAEEMTDGFTANDDWQLNARFIDGIRNRETLEKLLDMRPASDGLVKYSDKTKVGDLKKMLIEAVESGLVLNLSWFDFPSKELG